MRASSILRKASSDPFKSHVGDTSSFWGKVRKALVVNPESSSGNPLVLENRWPQPASRPEKFTVPASKASDVAENPYWKRDFRRMYPKTEVLTQKELATLLIAQGGFTSLPEPSKSDASGTALTVESAPSLAALYTSTQSTAVGTPIFKAPTPPGRKFKWSPASEEIPHDKDAYFPMYAASAREIV